MNKIKALAKTYYMDAVYTVLWFLFILGLIKCGSYPYDILRNIGLFFSLAVLIVIAMVLRKDELFSKPVFIIGGAYLVIALLYLWTAKQKNGWGDELSKMVLLQLFMWGVILIFLYFVVKNGINVDKKNLNVNLLAFMLLIFVLQYVTGGKAITVALALIPFYFAPVSKDEWKKQMVYLSIAMYLVFAFQMTVSLITAPEVMSGFRYVGIFFFPVTIGIMASIAIIGLVYLMRIVPGIITDKKKKRITMIVLAVLMVYPVVVTFMEMNRTSILSLIFMLIMMMFVNPNGKTRVRVKVLVTVGIVVFGLAFIFICYFLWKNGTLNQWQSAVGNKYVKIVLGYIIEVFHFSFEGVSSDGVFPDASFMEVINRLSSGRIGLWVSGIKGAELFGKQDIGVTTPNGSFMPHVHSTYINWIISYGWIIGCLFILWFFFCCTAILRKYKKGCSEYLLPFMLSQYFFVFCIFEKENWGVLSMLLFMVILYPLIRNFDEQAKE